MTKKSLTFNLLMLFIILSYFIVALIGTNGFSLFNGDNAAHIVQADYVKENPEQMFGWSRISYAGYPLFFFYQPIPEHKKQRGFPRLPWTFYCINFSPICPFFKLFHQLPLKIFIFHKSIIIKVI